MTRHWPIRPAPASFSLVAALALLGYPAEAEIHATYHLPYDGTEKTFRVTIAAAPVDQPDWLVSTFAAGTVRTVNARNKGRFTATWDGLDDNFMPVPAGKYVLKGIYAPAEKWKIDGQYHSLIPEFVASPGDSWVPPANQDHRFPPIHGHVFEPIYDVAVGSDGNAVFLSGYVENWRNPLMVNLNKPVGIDQVVRTWPSSGRSGGQHVAYDGRDVWMIRYNEVYCHTNPKFGTTRTKRGHMVAVLGTVRPFPTDLTVARGSQRSLLYACEPHARRITVLDGHTGTVAKQIDNIEAWALCVTGAGADHALYALNRVHDEWHVSSMALRGGLPDGSWRTVMKLPAGPAPRDLAIDARGRFYVLRGRQVFGYDSTGTVTLTIGKDKRLDGKYDPQVLIHPNKLTIWTDSEGRSRLLVTETGGPMRIGEWSCDDGSLLRRWHLCQNAAGGFCVDPDNPRHLYTTSLNTPELLRYVVDYQTGQWKIDAVWEGICHRNMQQEFPGGRMFPQIIRHKGHKYLCFAGGAFRAYGAWIVYRQDGDRWLPAAACVKNQWWHDANGDGKRQQFEVDGTANQGVGTYWAGKFLDDLSIVEVPKRGHAVRRLAPDRLDDHGNPVYVGDQWKTLLSDPISTAIAAGKADTLEALRGGNEVGNHFWDWSDVTKGDDGSVFVAGVYKPDGITGYKFDEAGQVGAQWKLTRWIPNDKGKFDMAWRIGRKAFGPAKPGEVYATMHVGAPVHGLIGTHDGNGLYHVFTTDGLYVDTLMYDRFRFGNMTRGGMYCHSGGSYFGRHFLNRDDGQIYLLMGRASNNIYRVPQWKPDFAKPLAISTTELQLKPDQIADPPKHIVDLRRRHRLPVGPPKPLQRQQATGGPTTPELAVKDVMRPFDADRMIRLTDRKPVAAKASYHRFGVNQYTGDQRQRIPVVDGKPCKEFLFAHAPSAVVYEVPSGYTTFTAVGTTLNKRDFAFVLRADGRELLRTTPLSKHGQAVAIRVSLPARTKRLELIVDQLQSPRADHAIWAYPRLSR